MLEIKNLSKTYEQKKFLKTTRLKVLTNINLYIKQGEIWGLVGESGSGKSTLARIIAGLEAPDTGSIVLENKTISFPRKSMPHIIQMVFQDPLSSLNPKQKIKNILDEPLKLNTNYPHKKRLQIIKSWLKNVNLLEESLEKYPHQFSGGQRQRIALARAFILQPKLIILDEPVSALDVSVQAQILLLLKQLQKQYKTTYLFISHDLAVIRYLATKVAVIYKGHILEQGLANEIFSSPAHPYTKLLLSCAPKLKGKISRILFKKNTKISSHPNICPFVDKCPVKKEQCFQNIPKSIQLSSTHSYVCLYK